MSELPIVESTQSDAQSQEHNSTLDGELAESMTDSAVIPPAPVSHSSQPFQPLLKRLFAQWKRSRQQAKKRRQYPLRGLAESRIVFVFRWLCWSVALPWPGFIPRRPIHRRRRFWFAVTLTGLMTGMGYSAYELWLIEQSLPDVRDIAAFERDGTLTLKAANGEILMQSGPATREKLELNQMPQELVQAFIAIEDRRFYQHRGIDYLGIVRAVISNILEQDLVQGGSTITQQLARIVFLNQERSLIRKVREALLARKIEQELSKEGILERYLNLVYLGSGAYGVADAAWVYFSKPVELLSLAEMATLAGLPPAPSEYSPLVNPDAAKRRRNLVLQEMQKAGMISAEAAQRAINETLAVEPSAPKRLQVQAPYFSRYIQKQLPNYISSDALEVGGLTVETTLNLKWQKIAEQVMEDAVNIDGAAEGFSEAALVSLETKTGEIKAMVGGVDFEKSEFNRATQAQRQPGSTFKSIVYATAIATGFSPYDSYQDIPFIVDGYQPKNFGNKYSGWRSLMDALTSSTNVIAVQLLIDVGFEPTIKLAHDLGIKSELQPTYSLALGASEVNLLELTNAYGTFALEGKYVTAHGIRRVLNQQGEVIYQSNFKPKQVLDKESAAIITWMLEKVVQSGTGGPAYLSDRSVAGKTGTSDRAADLWFIGYIPQVVTGVWLGNDNNDPTWGSSGTAAFNWREFMVKATEGMPVQDFPSLPDLSNRKTVLKAKPVQPYSIKFGVPAEPDSNSPETDPYLYQEPYYDGDHSNEQYY